MRRLLAALGLVRPPAPKEETITVGGPYWVCEGEQVRGPYWPFMLGPPPEGYLPPPEGTAWTFFEGPKL